MTVSDIIKRVQSEIGNATGETNSDWTDTDYILSKLLVVGDDIAIRLQLLDLNYSTQEIILPNVAANTTDLSAFQGTGQILSQMIVPKSIEWRLVGQNQQQWAEVEQVDKIIDTDTGTGEGVPGINTQTSAAVTVAGAPFQVGVNSVAGMMVGGFVTVDAGASREIVQITGVSGSPLAFTATFKQLHALGVMVTSSAPGVTSDDPTVESWEWRGGVLKISPSMEPVDLRVRFVGTSIPLDTNSTQQIVGLTNIYVYKTCEKIMAERGVGVNSLSTYFSGCYNRSCADFEGLSVKSQQSKINRFGGRRSACDGGWDSGLRPPIINN